MASLAGVQNTVLLGDDPAWLNYPLAPDKQIEPPARPLQHQLAICALYDRLGHVLGALASQHRLRLALVLALWILEGGWRPFRKGLAPTYLKVDQLFDDWGCRAKHTFNSRFRFGGHNLQPGSASQNHEYRREETGSFRSVHHNPKTEAEALILARMMAGDEVAIACCSIGAPPVPLQDHLILGYSSGKAMYNALQDSEVPQILAFFDLCRLKAKPKSGDLLRYLQSGDLVEFARAYRGQGDETTYASSLNTLQQQTQSLLNGYGI